MGSKICMNEFCRTTTSPEWKKGWGLKSGALAALCYKCGSAYEKLLFCETFHREETGWRECVRCEKRIHCGCIASKYLYDCLDYGGVGCINCLKQLEPHPVGSLQIPTADVVNGTRATSGLGDLQPLLVENRIAESNTEHARLMLLSKSFDANDPEQLFQSQKDNGSSLGQIRAEETMVSVGDGGARFSNFNQQPNGSSVFSKPEHCRGKQGVNDRYEGLSQPSLNFSLSAAPSPSNSVLPFSGGAVEGREQNKVSPFQQGQRTRQILPKPPKPNPSTGSEANKGVASQARIARPPGEGRGGRNQLLPRYWPRITDQELQQLSGDLNSTIVPLFEKVLSASDAGRIGRLVLPKACAEAYFPTINQSEGLPIRIQDIKGKEWTFQFRFWPNNNSRMYVLEGVTPCIQNMQLQAGDTVTFSRIDPGGKLVMGFRKATNNSDIQDLQVGGVQNGSSAETSISGISENIVNGARTGEDNIQRVKKSRNIGSKNKRLLMNSEDAQELRVTWEEAQELLRADPTSNPTVMMVEDYDFEEHEKPPVIGKRSMFTVRSSGEQEQWAQCDSCSRWRRLPVHVLLPASWTCAENIWDPSRSSCSAADEISPKELDAFFKASKDFKRRRYTENKVAEDCEPSGLDALATAAVLGDNINDLAEASVGATTRHPRHRPGCTCIVCIQPPSGKGKHQPTCKCNVCLTVRRRFKTLMLRKKKKQSEREAELAQGRDQVPSPNGPETDGGPLPLHMNNSDNERSRNGNQVEVAESSKGQLDLNCHPNREDDMLAEAAAGISMASIVKAASLPLEMFLQQSRLVSAGPCSLPQAAGESEGHLQDEGFAASSDEEEENKDEDED